MQHVHPESAPVHFVRDDGQALALFASIARERAEACAFAYLDPKWRLVGMRHMRSGLHDMVRVPLREIVRDALSFGARIALMAHNHPSGDTRPSDDDIRLTRQLARALDAIGVRLADHFIMTPAASVSIRETALL